MHEVQYRAAGAELRSLTGDTGGRALFDKYDASIVRVTVTEPEILLDIDTPADYRHAAEVFGAKSKA